MSGAIRSNLVRAPADRDPAVTADPVLHLLAGPNGAGKTTLATRVIAPATHLPFVNADHIAAKQWPDAAEEHSYDAADVAAQRRGELIAAGVSFITETVFSHASKVELVRAAQDAGYLVTLHVVVIPEDTTVARVQQRVRHGGHTVPEEKIHARYRRLWPLVVRARDLADRTLVYDNSSAAQPFRLIAMYEQGHLVGIPDWPFWTPTDLRS